MNKEVLKTWREMSSDIQKTDDMDWESASIIAAVLCVAAEVKDQTDLMKKEFKEVLS